MKIQIKTLNENEKEANIKNITDISMASMEEVTNWYEFFDLIKDMVRLRKIKFEKTEPIIVELNIDDQTDKILMF